MPKVINFGADEIYDLMKTGMTQRDAAETLGISIPTLTKKMAEIKERQGLLMKYREVQSLELTAIQARILEAITPEKIEMASLRDLVLAFKILKEKEFVVDGKPTEIKGLVHYLIEIEKQEAALDGDYVVEESEVETCSADNDIPNL